MCNFLKNIFSSHSIQTTPFFTFYQKLASWKSAKVFPYSFNLPEAISMPESFWSDVIKIYRMTDADGRERAISVWYADKELIVTSVTKGDETSVVTKDSIHIRYVPHPTKKAYYRKEVLVNDKKVKQTEVFHERVPKKIEINYLFNMHTHPKEVGIDGMTRYSFFSVQDIRSLISSKAIMTGLVTDKLWFLVRTSETSDYIPYNDGDILTVEGLKNDMKLGVYCADFNRKAIRQ
jgi:hypothetical protein